MYTERKWTNYEKISKKLIKKKLVQAGSTSLGSGKNKKDKKGLFFGLPEFSPWPNWPVGPNPEDLEWKTRKNSGFSARPNTAGKMSKARGETQKSPKSVHKSHFHEIGLEEPQVLNRGFWALLDLVACMDLAQMVHDVVEPVINRIWLDEH